MSIIKESHQSPRLVFQLQKVTWCFLLLTLAKSATGSTNFLGGQNGGSNGGIRRPGGVGGAPIFRRNPRVHRRRGYQSPSSTFQRPKSSSNNFYDDDDVYTFEEEEEETPEEKDKIQQIKRGIETRTGGFRPWIVDTRPKRPGSHSFTSKLIMTNIAMYVLQMISPSITKAGIKQSHLILQGRELYRLITPVFLHGSLTHLAMNTYSLQNIGPEMEGLFGGGRFLATYMVGGAVGNYMSALNTPNPSLGASGAVFGLMGAYYTFLSRNERIFGRSAQRQMESITGTLAMNVIFGFLSPAIDNWGHIGGAIGGAAMAMTFGPKLYLMALPNGGKMLVDKPTVRLPRSIESIPEKVGKRMRQAKLRMQMDRFQSDLKAKPWRRNDPNINPQRRRQLKPRFKQ